MSENQPEESAQHRRSKCSNAGNRLLQLDKFTSPVTLSVNEQGDTSVPSSFGAGLTIVLYAILAAYGVYKFMRVAERKNFNLMETVVK